MRKLGLLLCGAVLRSVAHAQGGTSDPALARGWEQVRASDFGAALSTLEPVVRRLSLTPGQDKDLASAHLAIGVACLLGLEQEKAARAHFREALRHDPDATVGGLKQPGRVLAILDEVRARLREARRMAALDSAWSEASRVAEDGTRTEAARIAVLRQFMDTFPEPNPHRSAAERQLERLRATVRQRLGARLAGRTDRFAKATYAGGTVSSLQPGTQGRLSVEEPERMVFISDRGSFVPIGYAYLASVESGTTKRGAHRLAVAYDDLDGRRQTLVLELSGKLLPSVVAAVEARWGAKVRRVDELPTHTR